MIPPQHEETITEKADADEVEQIERPEHCWIGFQEFPCETLQSIPSHEKVETVAQKELRSSKQGREIERQKAEHGYGLIKLHRVTVDAVAKIHAPGKSCRRAIGVIRQTCEITAETSDGDAERQRGNEHKPG